MAAQTLMMPGFYSVPRVLKSRRFLLRRDWNFARRTPQKTAYLLPPTTGASVPAFDRRRDNLGTGPQVPPISWPLRFVVVSASASPVRSRGPRSAAAVVDRGRRRET